MKYFNNQSGQTLLILLLSTLVALTIGLAITQRSLTDVSNSTKVEQSSRAFSAAEAGIEKIYNPNISAAVTGNIADDELGNSATANAYSTGPIPIRGVAGGRQPGLEYPPIDKTAYAQFWLANPDQITVWLNGGALTSYYQHSSVLLYFGNPGITTDYPAVEGNLVYYDPNYTDPSTSLTGPKILSRRYYFDRSVRLPNSAATCGSSVTAYTYSLNTVNSLNPQDSQFLCYGTIPLDYSNGKVPLMVRARILYSESAQKVGLVPPSSCTTPNTCGMPAQAVIYTSQGKSGQSLRQLQLFTVKSAVPFYFDFSIFSAGSIEK